MSDTNAGGLNSSHQLDDAKHPADSGSLKSSCHADNRDQHSSPHLDCGSNSDDSCRGTGGGCCSKENMTNTSRVTKKVSKKKKNLCYFAKCTSIASKFIGDCNFCKGHFCSKHRLMENHACEGLTSCKEAMHKRNADKLAAEQIRAPKIQI